MLLFYDSDTIRDYPDLLSEYQAAARALAASDLASKVMVAKMDADIDQNKVMLERFDLKQLPFIAWLTKGDQDWSGISGPSAESWLS